MKKLILVMMVGLLGITTSEASRGVTSKDYGRKKLKRYRNTQPVQFNERGVTYFIYPNGEINFNIGNRIGRRGYITTSYSSPSSSFDFGNRRRGQRVQYDRYGNVIRIGRTFIDYDRYGRVDRVGSVYMDYGRFGNLIQVGNMRVKYNRWGKLVFAQGQIKSGFCGICGTDSCGIDHLPHNDQLENWDDDFEYKKRKKYKKRKYDHWDD